MNGEGKYAWVDLAGNLQRGTNWNDIPDDLEYLVTFVPEYPEPEHTPEQHAYMATFDDKLHEILKRCRK